MFTKVFRPSGHVGHNNRGFGRKHIHESIDMSLTRLDMDYVDLYRVVAARARSPQRQVPARPCSAARLTRHRRGHAHPSFVSILS